MEKYMNTELFDLYVADHIHTLLAYHFSVILIFRVTANLHKKTILYYHNFVNNSSTSTKVGDMVVPYVWSGWRQGALKSPYSVSNQRCFGRRSGRFPPFPIISTVLRILLPRMHSKIFMDGPSERTVIWAFSWTVFFFHVETAVLSCQSDGILPSSIILFNNSLSHKIWS